MGTKAQIFKQIPWVGGANTSLDDSAVPPNQLTIADDIVFGVRGSRKKRDGINFNWDSATGAAHSIIGLHDFWFGTTSSKTQYFVGVRDDKKVYSYTPASGTASSDLFAGTAWSSVITTASMSTINNLCIIAVDGTGNVVKKWSGSGNIADLGGTPPVASISRVHLGRLWANDKTAPDRLHYSATGNAEVWNGADDSGAIDIGIGDGDPTGISAIFPPFQGALFVAKSTKLYRIDGLTPESFKVTKVSDGIGCVSHNSVASIDESDIFFVSQRGIHSLATTSNFGDFQAQYISFDIQKTFNDSFPKSRLPYSWGAYNSNLNSYALAISDSSVSSTVNKTIWLYNIPLKSWYRWKNNISCQSMIASNDTDKKRFYLGTNDSRVAKTLNGTNYDINTSNSNVAISNQFRTGYIYPDGNEMTTKRFLWLSIFYRPQGQQNLTVTVSIDNQASQSLAIVNSTSTDSLGTTFYLGTSILGGVAVTEPATLQMDGYGRGIQLTFANTSTDQAVEIQGFAFGWELADFAQENA